MRARGAWRALAAAVAVLAVAGTACEQPEMEPAPVVVLGIGSSEEQQVLAALTIVALDQVGVRAELRTGQGDTVRLRREALRGRIDLFWDYTGAAWALGLGQQGPPADPLESYERVREEDAEQGLRWLDPTGANATLALFVRAEDLAEQGDLTWLATELSAGGRRLCADEDFLERPAGYEALAEEYAIQRGAVALEEATELEAIRAVEDGRCFAGLATATSGEARLAGLVPVIDDQLVFPAFVVAPVGREEALERVPEMAEALHRVAALLSSTEALAVLNAELAAGADPQELAEGVLGAASPAASTGS